MRTNVILKINYRVDEDMKRYRREHKNTYLDLDSSKYQLWAGTYRRRCGSLIVEANTYEDAKKLALNNPFMGSKFYSCEILDRKKLLEVS
ncbi:MAG: hypothetical protein ACRCTZ_08775 [Sarcina sp.]